MSIEITAAGNSETAAHSALLQLGYSVSALNTEPKCQIAVAGTDRTYTVVMFRDQTGAEPPERISQFATSVHASWERFARQEKGMVVRQFQRTDLTPGLSVMSMATEFGSRASRQYYVQFAATNGAESAVIFAEGSGSAAKALTELEPLIKRVQMVPR